MNGIETLELIRNLNPAVRLVLVTDEKNPDFDWYVNNERIDRVMLKTDLLDELAVVA